jgi:outer membrane protein TolC
MHFPLGRLLLLRQFSLRVYDLPNLIDLAQQTNPETRAAWEATRASAARLGIAEGAYLPTLGAIGMASYAHLPDYDKMGPFLVRTGVLEPLVRLDWLLLDFGRRTADLDSAAQTLLAANLQFNRKQQSVIFAVQKAYFTFDASRARVKARETALKAATAVEQATGSRSGLASITDTLLARQVVLQQQFDIASAQRDVHAAEAQLAQAIGISPTSLLQVASLSSLPLPEGLPASEDSLLQQAVSTRPDLATKFADVRAREAELERARADYLPRLSVSGELGGVFRELDRTWVRTARIFIPIEPPGASGPSSAGSCAKASFGTTGCAKPRRDAIRRGPISTRCSSRARPRCGRLMPTFSRPSRSISSPLPSSPRRSPHTKAR